MCALGVERDPILNIVAIDNRRHEDLRDCVPCPRLADSLNCILECDALPGRDIPFGSDLNPTEIGDLRGQSGCLRGGSARRTIQSGDSAGKMTFGLDLSQPVLERGDPAADVAGSRQT